MFCRLKDVRRAATSYDTLAEPFAAVLRPAAIVTWWIRGPSLKTFVRPQLFRGHGLIGHLDHGDGAAEMN